MEFYVADGRGPLGGKPALRDRRRHKHGCKIQRRKVMEAAAEGIRGLPSRLGNMIDGALTLGAASFAALAATAPLWPAGDLATHFTWQFAMVTALASVFRWFRGCARGSALMAALCLAACVQTWQGYSPAFGVTPVRTSASERRYSLLQYNIRYTTATRDAKKTAAAGEPQGLYAFLQRTIAEQDPDFILLQEATPYAETAMRPLTQAYPWRALYPQKDAFGMLFYSKHPITSQKRGAFHGSGNAYTRLTLMLPGQSKPFILWELHAGNPLHEGFKGRHRNIELSEIARMIGQEERSGIQKHALVGDLNCTPFSPVFAELEKQSGLVSVTRGGLPLGTWPSKAPGLMRIPIDHMLTPTTVAGETQTQILPYEGSDHVPLIRRFLIP